MTNADKQFVLQTDIMFLITLFLHERNTYADLFINGSVQQLDVEKRNSRVIFLL